MERRIDPIWTWAVPIISRYTPCQNCRLHFRARRMLRPVMTIGSTIAKGHRLYQAQPAVPDSSTWCHTLIQREIKWSYRPHGLQMPLPHYWQNTPLKFLEESNNNAERNANRRRNQLIGIHCPPGPRFNHPSRREEGRGYVCCRHRRSRTVQEKVYQKYCMDGHKEVDTVDNNALDKDWRFHNNIDASTSEIVQTCWIRLSNFKKC